MYVRYHVRILGIQIMFPSKSRFLFDDKFEMSTATKFQVNFWVVTPCSVVKLWQRVPPERWSPTIKLLGVTTQKTSN
jgi:hypothetical protein